MMIFYFVRYDFIFLPTSYGQMSMGLVGQTPTIEMIENDDDNLLQDRNTF